MLIGLYVVYIKGCMKETEVDIFTPVNYLSIWCIVSVNSLTFSEIISLLIFLRTRCTTHLKYLPPGEKCCIKVTCTQILCCSIFPPFGQTCSFGLPRVLLKQPSSLTVLQVSEFPSGAIKSFILKPVSPPPPLHPLKVKVDIKFVLFYVIMHHILHNGNQSKAFYVSFINDEEFVS